MVRTVPPTDTLASESIVETTTAMATPVLALARPRTALLAVIWKSLLLVAVIVTLAPSISAPAPTVVFDCELATPTAAVSAGPGSRPAFPVTSFMA